MGKKIFGVMALFFFLFFLTLTANASEHYKIESKILSQRDGSLEIKGSYPVLSGFGNPSFETAVNERIEEIFKEKKASAKDALAKSLTFTYTVAESADITTLLLYSTINTSIKKAEINSVNFNGALRKWVGITDILGLSGVSIANNAVSEFIRNEPDRYYPNFTGIEPNEAFWVTDEGVAFMFDAFRLAPGSEGIVSFTIYFDNIVEIVISYDEYWKKEDSYDIRMIPLRKVVEALGFRVDWTEDDNAVAISKTGAGSVELVPENNLYFKKDNANKVVSRILEVAPELFEGTTYVPISFFDQLLEQVTYHVDEDENIVFSIYLNF